MSDTYLLERAAIAGEVVDDVLVGIAGGRFCEVVTGAAPDLLSGRSYVRLPGITVPGFANTHSHAFHRALRGRTQRDRGTFWTWREQMYAVAERLDPDSYRELARGVYGEMVAAGITTVGEFHYLHHAPDGASYSDANELGLALIDAAREVGLRIALLDTCYLSAGFGAPPQGVQRRYDDGSADAWAERVTGLERLDLAADSGVRIGAAIHSVRAVPRDQLAPVVEWASGRPLHAHVSEQPAENEQCHAAYGLTPVGVLANSGAIGPRFTAIHATHLSEEDIATLGAARSWAGFCPTTERDLADGIGPARRLADAGARLSLGSDSHAVIDPCEEMRALELDERLASGERGHFSAAELLDAATAHQSLGFDDAGQIAVGQRADLVTFDTTSVRTAGAGADLEMVAFAASSADVTHVVIDGRAVTLDRRAVAGQLGAAIERLWT